MIKNFWKKQSGNMMFALFGAVAVVGAVGASTTALMRGPMQTMALVNQSTLTQTQIIAASKMVMLDVANMGAADCDSDRMNEPRPWRSHSDNGPDDVAANLPTHPASDGGGFIPNEVGTSKRDPWGTQFGYCVWDHGSITTGDAGACGDANRLDGGNKIDYPVIAVISAGPNETFESPCLNFSSADIDDGSGTGTVGSPLPDGDLDDAADFDLVVPQGDDIVIVYSYAQAAQENPGLWQLDIDTDIAGGNPEAKLNFDVEFSGSETAIGSLLNPESANLRLTGVMGLDIPTDAALITCDATTDGQIRRNMSGSSVVIEICQNDSGWAWGTLSTGTGATTASSNTSFGISTLASDIMTWGRDTLGQLGNGAATGVRHAPERQVDITNFVQVSAGYNHACGVDAEGKAWCWGEDIFGMLGNGGSNTNVDIPTQVSNIENFTQIAAGVWQTCGVTDDYKAYCWGQDSSGLLGNGAAITANQSEPSQVITTENFIQIDVGGISGGYKHACAVSDQGEIWCWGGNNDGQLGNGTTTTGATHEPVKVIGGITNFIQVAAASTSTCGLTATGRVYCWGSDGSGKLGQGVSTADQTAPIEITGGINDFVQISGGVGGFCGVRKTGRGMCWGIRPGNNSNSSYSPVNVWYVKNFSTIDAGYDYSCGVTTEGEGYCWGFDYNGQLGNGSAITSVQNTPVKVLGGPFQYISTGQQLSIGLAYPSQDYVADATITQPSPAGTTLGSMGLSVASSDDSQQPGIAFSVGDDITPTDQARVPSASITFKGESASSVGGLAFKTKGSFGDLQASTYLDRQGQLGLGMATLHSNDVLTSIQINDHFDNSISADYSKGLLIPQGDHNLDRLTYFGYEGDDDASAVILYDDTDGGLHIIKGDIYGNIADHSFKFDSNFDIWTTFDLAQHASGDAAEFFHQFFNDTATNSPDIVFQREQSGQAIVADGDTIGAIGFQGRGAAGYGSTGHASISGIVNGTPGASDVPVDLVFGTDSGGDALSNERMRITSDGNVGVGTAAPDAMLHSGGRIAADQGIQIGDDSNCSVANDTDVVRYTDNANAPYERCDGSSWVNLTEDSDPDINCSPIGFEFYNVDDVTASAVHETNTIRIGGLTKACYLSVTSDGSVTINKNGTDESGTLISVENGDRIKLKITASANNADYVTTHVTLGDQSDEVTVQTAGKIAFVTNSPYNPITGGGVEGAHAFCNNWAKINSVKGNFLAWIGSSDAQDAPDKRFRQYSGNYYQPDRSTIIANGWSDLTDGTLDNPINALLPNGASTYSGNVLTSVTTSGAAESDHCLDWTSSDSGDSYTVGLSHFTNSNWSASGSLPCNLSVTYMYCIEQ